MRDERSLGAFAVPSQRLAFLGADLAPCHFAFDLALGLDVAVDLLPDLVRLRRVEVELLLEDVRQAAARHPDVIEVLHQDQGIHRGEVRRVVHLLHGRILARRARPGW